MAGATEILGEPDGTFEEFKARREEEKLAGASKREEARAAEGRVVDLLSRFEASDAG